MQGMEPALLAVTHSTKTFKWNVGHIPMQCQIFFVTDICQIQSCFSDSKYDHFKQVWPF